MPVNGQDCRRRATAHLLDSAFDGILLSIMPLASFPAFVDAAACPGSWDDNWSIRCLPSEAYAISDCVFGDITFYNGTEPTEGGAIFSRDLGGSIEGHRFVRSGAWQGVASA
jgi:hypothetical protein